jgi:predicted amidohydrolase YtcJ
MFSPPQWLLALVVFVAFAASCSARSGPPDGGAPLDAGVDAGPLDDAGEVDAGPPLSLAIVHAQLFTDVPGADAVGVEGDTIVAVGSTESIVRRCSAGCQLVNVDGGFVMPGFHDAHVHPYEAGREAFELDVFTASVPTIQAAVRSWAAAHPSDAWLFGQGWLSALFTTWPTAADLDAAESTRPVVLTDNTGHNLWVNSAALAAAGITATTPDPPGGSIAHPLGVLIDAAQTLVTDREPELTDQDIETFIQKGQSRLLAVGVTSSAESGTEPLRVAQAYARLDGRGQLKGRVFLWAPLYVVEPELTQWYDFARSLPQDGKVRVVAFKGFADGTIAARTAALLQPYTDAPGTSGQLYYPQALLDSRVQRANAAGYPVAIHAIGDRAVRQALDAFEHSLAALHHTLINRVEHANVVDPADAPRFGTLGVAASVQPVWLYTYPSLATFTYVQRLGPARLPMAFAWATLQRGGAKLIFGSDLPSSNLFDPLTGVYAAAQRRLGDEEVFLPGEAISADDALRAYTRAAPEVMGLKSRLGKIEVGQLADLVWLARDPRVGARSTVEDPLRRIWVGGVELSAQ